MNNVKCNLIVDSCCDLPYELLNKENVDLIEFPYFFDDEEHLDDMFQTTSPKEFYDRMRNGEQPHTAGATFQMLKDTFDRAVQKDLPSVYLSFSSGLSGHFDQVIRVRDMVLEEHPDAELYVVDTHLASTGEALIVFEALRQQEAGLTAKELADWALEAQYFVNVYFMVDDLESLRRGGRISSTVAFAGSKLDVKPVLFIDVDGKLAIKGIARGRKKGLKQLAEFYHERAEKVDGTEFVMGATADASKDLDKLEELLHKGHATPCTLVKSNIGPVIGCHVGPGMVAVSFWGPDKREEVSVADRIARKVKGEN